MNLERLIQLIPRRHDDQDVHVAVGVRLPVGMGAEQDDFMRMKSFGDLMRKTPNQPHRNLGATVPPRYT